MKVQLYNTRKIGEIRNQKIETEIAVQAAKKWAKDWNKRPENTVETVALKKGFKKLLVIIGRSNNDIIGLRLIAAGLLKGTIIQLPTYTYVTGWGHSGYSTEIWIKQHGVFDCEKAEIELRHREDRHRRNVKKWLSGEERELRNKLATVFKQDRVDRIMKDHYLRPMEIKNEYDTEILHGWNWGDSISVPDINLNIRTLIHKTPMPEGKFTTTVIFVIEDTGEQTEPGFKISRLYNNEIDRTWILQEVFPPEVIKANFVDIMRQGDVYFRRTTEEDVDWQERRKVAGIAFIDVNNKPVTTNSNHIAEKALVDGYGQLFAATGKITHPEHKELVLEGWWVPISTYSD